ncbi:MAG TPA: alkaline phosphatase family protein [Candidatus Polarisedimenticolia bacterium]|jgi:tetratricopeptide (TPR) repeat protein|nr:alkaline phosphatase family protein [Candidatus Polarisedimenticolia bacterium]
MPRKPGPWLPASLFLLPILVLCATLTRVPAGFQAVQRGGFGLGSPKVLAPGLHFRIPLLQTVHRYPSARLAVDGTGDFTSSEGVSLRLPYHFSGRIDPARLGDFDERARGRPVRVFLQEAVQRTLSAWLSGESAAKWTAGESRSIPDAVAGELAALGLQEVRLVLGSAAGAPEARRASAITALQARSRSTGRKILLIGLDGADWQLIDPWIREGKLPTLARLKSAAAWANLKSMQPILSPLLWTTVATGRTPEEHGIVDFLVKDPGTGERVPISSRFRKVEALWNIFSEMGRTVDVVAWWASWPSEPIRGVMISDRVSYSLFGYQADAEKLPGATYPEDFLATARGRLVSDADITLGEVRKFADVTAVDFQERRARIQEGDPRKAYADPVNHLTRILASTRNYQTLALELLGRGQSDLTMLYFQGIDEVGHRFAHMMPPKMAMVTDDEYRQFHGVVEAFYRYQDRLLGEILQHADPRTTVVLLSDHGFKNGSGRPTDDPPYIEGKPGKWHRLYGIFLIAGPGVRPGALDTVSLLDVAPTVLALAGIPPSREMKGRVLAEALRPAEAKSLALERVETYELGARPESSATATTEADRQMIESLRSLGYIASGDGGGGSRDEAPSGELTGDTVTYHSNLAALHLKSKNFAKAQAEIDAALRIVPDYLPALMTQASLDQATGRTDKALEVYRKIVDSGGSERGVMSSLAGLFEKSGRLEEGIAYFSRLRESRPGVAEASLSLGRLREAKGEAAAAEALYRQAVREDPAGPEAAARLFEILKKKGEEATLKPEVARGLSLNENSVGHHNLMGLILEREGDWAGAEKHLRRAAELDPDYAGVLANLGSLCARTGRLEESIRILSRAVAKEPTNYEARMNLGAALGKAGRHREAIAQFEETRRRGFRSPALFNGLAVAYHETGQIQKCIESLKESLSLDPAQPEVRALLSDVESQRS